MANNYDVIVIGAGNGGLIAAATASRLGKKTLLLERHNIPGGAATSFTRGRFEFEVSLHELAAYGSKEHAQGIRKMFDWLGLDDDLQMKPIPGVYRYVIPGENGFDVALPNGRDEVIKKMEEVVPGSKESVIKLFDLGEECIRGFNLLQGGMPIEKIKQQCPNFIRYATTPYQDVLDEIKMPKKAQQILEAYWCYIGIPADEFNFPYFAQMVVIYVEYDAYAPQGSSHELSSTIVKKIQEYGGTVWFNTEVKKIITKDGQAVGIQVGDQTVYGKEIICNAMPNTVYANMLDQQVVPKSAVKLANARQIGTSGFMVYLGLNKSPEELGIKDYSLFTASTPDSRQQFENMNTIDHNDFMIMNCLNIAVPNCSPKGTTILYATQLYRTGTWDQIKPADYQNKKVEIARRIIRQYERASGIKISDAIEEIEIAAPETFARYMRTPNGSIYGYYGQPWDQTFGRLVNMQREVEPIDHLYFCGGDSYMMDGYSSAYFTGFSAAQMACKDIDKGEN